MHKLIVLLIAGTLVVSCDREYDSYAEPDPTPYVEDTHYDSETVVPEAEWESFKRETELTIDANQAKLRELRNTVSAKKAPAVAELEEKNELMRRSLREYTYDDEEGWVKFRDVFSTDLQELGEAIDGVYTQ